MEEIYEYILSEFKKTGRYSDGHELDIFWAELSTLPSHSGTITSSVVDMIRKLSMLKTNKEIAEFINNEVSTSVSTFKYNGIEYAAVIFSYYIPNELRRGYND